MALTSSRIVIGLNNTATISLKMSRFTENDAVDMLNAFKIARTAHEVELSQYSVHLDQLSSDEEGERF